jgi:hypothetical protein
MTIGGKGYIMNFDQFMKEKGSMFLNDVAMACAVYDDMKAHIKIDQEQTVERYLKHIIVATERVALGLLPSDFGQRIRVLHSLISEYYITRATKDELKKVIEYEIAQELKDLDDLILIYHDHDKYVLLEL